MKTNSEITYIDVRKISPHPNNPRKDVGDVTELAESIKANGVLQNLTVVKRYGEITGEFYGDYTVIIGHRRLAAAKLAGLETVPCTVVEMTDKEQIGTMLTENMQRTDLTVYEEAQGFQMMLDLGETVDTVAEKTGFSTTTVKRRVKMTELDQTVLKEVASRQIAIGDFDRLAKIDDIEKRNAVLREIGTSNFNMSCSQAIKKQEIAKALPLAKEEIRRLKGKQLANGKQWSGDYEKILSVSLEQWDRETPFAPDAGDKKLYYILDEFYGTLSFYKESSWKSAPVKRSPDEIAREKAIAEAWKKVDELESTARELRWDFVDNLRLTKQNRDKMLKAAATACLIGCVGYVPKMDEDISKKLGIETAHYTPEKEEKSVKAFNEQYADSLPIVILSAFGEGRETFEYGNRYSEQYRRNYPKYKACLRLDCVYDWLCACGYVMSDDEKALRDGSHEIFQMEVEKDE